MGRVFKDKKANDVYTMVKSQYDTNSVKIIRIILEESLAQFDSIFMIDRPKFYREHVYALVKEKGYNVFEFNQARQALGKTLTKYLVSEQIKFLAEYYNKEEELQNEKKMNAFYCSFNGQDSWLFALLYGSRSKNFTWMKKVLLILHKHYPTVFHIMNSDGLTMRQDAFNCLVKEFNRDRYNYGKIKYADYRKVSPLFRDIVACLYQLNGCYLCKDNNDEYTFARKYDFIKEVKKMRNQLDYMRSKKISAGTKNCGRAYRLAKLSEKYAHSFTILCRGAFVDNGRTLLKTYADDVINNDCFEDKTCLVFEHEPTNEHDPNAIKILCSGNIQGKIGYVGKEFTEMVSDILYIAKEYRVELINDEEIFNSEQTMRIFYN